MIFNDPSSFGVKVALFFLLHFWRPMDGKHLLHFSVDCATDQL